MRNSARSFVTSIFILSLFVIPMNLHSADSVFAQRNNSVGQDGDGNDASQSEENTQTTNQNSQCVSGESNILSCNNEASESMGGNIGEGPEGPQGETGPTGETGPAGPQSVVGKMYQLSGPELPSQTLIEPGRYRSSIQCNPGDTAISSNFFMVINRPPIVFDNNLDLNTNTATVEVVLPGEATRLRADINCFNNP